jgi:hypothetical protein
MFKRTAGVSCSLKESLDGLEIIPENWTSGVIKPIFKN